VGEVVFEFDITPGVASRKCKRRLNNKKENRRNREG